MLRNFELLEGFWYGKKSIFLESKKDPFISPMIAKIESKKNGYQFLIPYLWKNEDNIQKGLLVLIRKNNYGLYDCLWSDTWHNIQNDMKLEGLIYNFTTFSFNGHYSVQNNIDWGWKIKIMSNTRDILQILMYNVPPEKDDLLAIEIMLHRVNEKSYLQKKEKYFE
jgi:hypothetical protein